MREWDFRDFVSPRGVNEIRTWLDGLPPRAKAKINARIRAQQAEPVDFHTRPQVGRLEDRDGQECEGLFELRIKAGGVEYRPLGYYPSGTRRVFVILIGATERGGALVPRGVCSQAFHRIGQLKRAEASTCEHDDG
jgi:hypothetical protein